MPDFNTWWNYRDGKETVSVLTILAVIGASIFFFYEPKEEDPDICSWGCIIDNDGIPRYREYREKYPEKFIKIPETDEDSRE